MDKRISIGLVIFAGLIIAVATLYSLYMTNYVHQETEENLLEYFEIIEVMNTEEEITDLSMEYYTNKLDQISKSFRDLSFKADTLFFFNQNEVVNSDNLLFLSYCVARYSDFFDVCYEVVGDELIYNEDICSQTVIDNYNEECYFYLIQVYESLKQGSIKIIGELPNFIP